VLLSQGLREKGEIFLSGELLLGSSRDMLKKALETGNSLNMGPVGEPRGGRGSFTMDLEIVILGLLFLDPEDIRNPSLGAFWNFSKGQGLP
jgi:hypothetical protein